MDQKIEFDIYLNDKKVGEQRIVIMPTDTGESVLIESEFSIKLLFVTVFSYKHTAKEDWHNSCLSSIETKTKENGETFFVSSQKLKRGLRIARKAETQNLEGCIRSFAYWDRQRLDNDWLLNGQTGKYVSAELISNGEEKLLVNNKEIITSRYKLIAEGSEINLWYDNNQNWVGLSTLVKGGRTLSYHLK